MTNEFKQNLNKFFREMRKKGYFARQNFWCCGSCGWSAIPKDKSDKAVFYHNQDTPDIKHGHVYICWEGNGTDICNTANECGLITGWNGDNNTRICLIGEKE